MTRKERSKHVVLCVLAWVGYLLLLPLWGRLRRLLFGEEYRVLTYHSVGNSRNHETNVRPATLRTHLQWLSQAARVVDLVDAVRGSVLDTSARGPLVCLTFDDGYADNLSEAAPILRKYGMPATCFVAAAYPDSGRVLPHDAGGGGDASVLTWDELRRLADGGVDIGSHGMEHVRFAGLDEDALKGELSGSKRLIESQLDRSVRAFSFPYGKAGDFKIQDAAQARRAGYEVVASAMYGRNRLGDREAVVRRIGVESSDTMFTFVAKMNGALDLLALAETRGVRIVIRLFNRLLGAS
jgi:peptidoglycan/xylan/chitin deacetylase (PgdA/CDA1 family)